MTFDSFKAFVPATMCLDMIKAGFGLTDAPRAWSRRLHQVLTAAPLCMTTLQADARIYVLWRQRKLRAALSTHVDDLKGASTEAVAKEIPAVVEREFGTLKVQWREFEHTGVQHRQDADGTVHTSQDHYVRQLRPIAEDGFKHLPEDHLADEE